MKDYALVCLVAFTAGAALACQVGANSRLRQEAGDPILAAFVSFLVGAIVLVAALILARPSLPSPADVARWPWWAWLGGVLGAGYVVSAAALAIRVGAASWLATVVAGQILTSLALDHFGWLGFAPRPVTPGRALGAALLIGGVALVLRR